MDTQETIVTLSNKEVPLVEEQEMENIVVRVHGGKGDVEDIVTSVGYILEAGGQIQLDLPGEEKARILRPENGLEQDSLTEGDYVNWIPVESLEEVSSRDRDKVYFSTKNFPKNLKAGDPFLVSDAELQFEVVEIYDEELVLKLIKKSSTGVDKLYPRLGGVCPTKSLAGSSLEKTIGEKGFKIVESLSEKGWLNNMSQFACSFVESGEDIDNIVGYFKEKGIDFNSQKLVLKLESMNAVEDNIGEIIEKIIKYKDQGVTIIPEIARGDLSVACSYAGENMNEVQRGIVEKFRENNIKYIIATNVFSSITNTFKFRNELRERDFTEAQVDDLTSYVLASDDSWERLIQLYPSLKLTSEETKDVFKKYLKKNISLKMTHEERKRLLEELKDKENLAGYMLAQEGIMASNIDLGYLVKEFKKTKELIQRYLEK
jgi:hypothetical protein